MKPNFLSVTFWFNIFDGHAEFLNILSDNLKDEFTEFKIVDKEVNNPFRPIITAVNPQTKSDLTFSKINLQYNMEKINMDSFLTNVQKIFDLLNAHNIKVLHSAIYANYEIHDKEALKKIVQNTLNKKIISDDLIDVNLKFGKKQEESFYKIISLINKKQIELPRLLDELNREVPIPLISWNKAIMKDEIIEIAYEINDKLIFDTSNSYFTDESYLNKMLYIFKNDMEDDIDNLINKGEF